jgi:hypothetical protein
MLFFLILNIYFASISLQAGDIGKTVFTVKPSSDFLLEDLVKYKQSYSKEGSVLVVGYDTPEVKKGEAIRIAGQLSKEIKNYLSYWIDYWSLKSKTVETEEYEENFNNVGEKEYVNIVLKDVEGSKNSEVSKEILEILNRLQNKEGIEIFKNERTVKINLDLLFEANSTDLKYSSTFILDTIVDVLKIANNNLGVKIEVHKKNVYIKGAKQKSILSWANKIGNIFEKKGIKQSDIYVYAKEDENITEKKVDVIFFNRKIDFNQVSDFNDYDNLNFSKKKSIVDKNKVRTYVFKDGDSPENIFYPTGWIGDSNDMQFDFNYRDKADSRDNTCIKIQYKANGNKGWAGLQWQYPPNNWGNKKESIDLSKFKKLVFFAKGNSGGERVAEFKIGGIQGQYGDSDVAWIGNIKLSNDWQRYEISLKDKNLKNMIGGFSLILTKYDNRYGCVFYLDDIYFE